MSSSPKAFPKYKGALTSCVATLGVLASEAIDERATRKPVTLAIYHLSTKPLSRASGRSAVAAMAYRAGVSLTNARDGLTHDYTAKRGVVHAEIVLPEGVEVAWARDRSDLWNGAEAAEKRKDARVAREFEIALPHELSAAERLAATREFAQGLADRYGAAVDFAIHAPHEEGDVRNFHAHVLMTTRQVTVEGLGEKTHIERENKWLLANSLQTTDVQLRELRQVWEQIANARLALAGFDIRIDHRSHEARGLEIAPTEHVGVHATQLERRGIEVQRARLDEEAGRRNADLMREKPEQVLEIITSEKSVFDRNDVARALHRYINDDAQEFQTAFAKVMASPALVELQAEREVAPKGESGLAKYSTREMVDLETRMIAGALRLLTAADHAVDPGLVAAAIARQDAAIQRSSGDASAGLSGEQKAAISHITGAERIAAVVGFAGAGKSTMLAAAREAWEGQGYRVHGAALSGKAAEGLEESAGIASRTLASWSRSWELDRHRIGRGDVFVIDEAGMVGSRQLARFVAEVEARGAKMVLVGDHEQLQAIGAGAPFRAITETIGRAELSEIRRQRVDWQREASSLFATHRTAEGLAAYRERGRVMFTETGEAARGEIVQDYLADREARPGGSRLVMAHRRADVQAINAAIRAELMERGVLARVAEPEAPLPGAAPAETAAGAAEAPRALRFQTNDGARDFAVGDRIVFLENNRELGVKNGMLGTVDAVAEGRIVAALDGREGAPVSVLMGDYGAVDHGYATTIHKTQGATVDRAYVLASPTMDRHLTYVAMTRHRDEVTVYAGQDDFADRRAGRLVEHGAAPFENKAENRESYFVTLENAKGERHTIWGVGLRDALVEAGARVGEQIGLKHMGSVPVTLQDGTETHRNGWKVAGPVELAAAQLEWRLSRSGAKETTLDYVSGVEIEAAIAFGERRGFEARASVLRSVKTTIARQTKRLANLVARFVQAAPVMATDQSLRAGQSVEPDRGAGEVQWLIAPKVETDRDGAKLATERALASPKVTEAERALKEAAAAVFRDAEAAMRVFRPLLHQPRDATDAMAVRLSEAPESVAEVRGATGFMVKRAAKAEREEALRAIARLRGRLREYRGMLEAMASEERRVEGDRSERLAAGVPALSREAGLLLDKLDGAARDGEKAFASALAEAKRDAAETLKSIDGFEAALRQRVGNLARFLAGNDDYAPGEVARADRALLAPHMPRIKQVERVTQSIEEARRLEQSRDLGLRL